MKVTIDGHTIDVEAGTTILQAARQIGGDLVPPAMCYHSKVDNTGGKCRVCMVKVTAGSEKDPRPMPKLVPSCVTTVQDGMVIENITNPQVLEARKNVVELLLINHPLDCPVCDQAGECKLQDLSYEHGIVDSELVEDKRVFDMVDIGDKIKLHMNRCILCYRCVYLADQLTPERVHGVMFRGDKAEISTYINKAIDNEMSGNVIDVCPVGALTDKTFRFKSRVWFLKPMNAERNCDKCCGKSTVWMFGDEIYRVTSRHTQYGEVEEFICNTCRYDKKSTSDWTITGPRDFGQASVINQNNYVQELKKVVIKADKRLL
ncbi:MAG: (2Fe-2S)-binding protein [Chitinophagales bacterium]|nr:2Fe-2S iron-sulfur cluster-binding protein [Chitinophagales bacterium]MCZ2392267.1 (2Fe-2S)-binding protein [Chitinophagales bacterium]